MTSMELRNAIYDEFIQKYYQSELCTAADNFDYDISQFGKSQVEEHAFELLEELADSVIQVMCNNNVLKMKKSEHKI